MQNKGTVCYRFFNRATLLPKCITAILVLCMTLGATAQSKDPINSSNGTLKGKVKDSTYNFMLTSATIAVYKDEDSSLLQFTLPNNFGEFTVQLLPTELPLRLVVTHVGYKPFLKKITIKQSQPLTEMGLLYMHQANDGDGNKLHEVVIKAIAPVRMNGDTVEFNADAFRMDSSATAEDLMRRLPGFTVWGDGEITYNGKKINAVLVDGKPFMGSSDPSIATQNLAKIALDKIQVYQQRDEKNPLDSTMFANIKLKEDKKMGYFGKTGGGYGTKKRYAADAMLSAFNKKLQLTTVGAFNNINKLAGNTDVLMKNSSFKGEGANIEYQSDFSMRGLNKAAAAGFKFQYDFIADPVYQKSSRLNVGYFISHNNALQDNHTVANTFLQADTLLTKRSQNTHSTVSNGQNLNAQFGKSTEKFNLNINGSVTENYRRDKEATIAVQEKTKAGIISNSSSENETESQGRSMTMGFDYTNRSNWENRKRVPREFNLGYQFTAAETDGSGNTKTQYASAVDPSANSDFDRYYERDDSRNYSHTIRAGYPGIKKLLFNERSFGGVEIEIAGTAKFSNTSNTDKVLDKDALSGKYTLNNYLSRTTDATLKDVTPELNISKNFYKGLTNRYNKYVSIAVHLKNQYFSMEHQSTLAFQNFSYTYSNFIPQANIKYHTHQYGDYEMDYGLDLTTSLTYPGVNQIAPVIDSTNVWYIPKGNPNIKPQYKKELGFTYNFTTRKPKNPLVINLSAGIGRIEDNITDSTLYNNAGVRTVYAVNINGNQFANSGINVKKSLELKGKNTFEVETRYNISLSRNPQYINSVLNISNSIYHTMRASLNFRHKDIVTMKLEQGISFYDAKQHGFNESKFKSNNLYTQFIGALQLPQKLVWSTNITYNKSGSNNSNPIYFTIWNASLTYRFLKSNRGEVKFSALDLLRQNKSIVNTSVGNTQTFTNSNVLQQYFMFTLSYYPRKFGK